MALIIDEQIERRASENGRQRAYLVRGTDIEAAAKAAVLVDPSIPSSLDGFAYRSVALRELGNLTFSAEVQWSSGTGSSPPAVDGDRAFSFEVSPASYSVHQSLSTVSTHAIAGETARDFKGAINVDGDLRVNGTQWPPPPTQVFSVTGSIDNAKMTQAYYRTLCSYAGCVNSDTFEGFPAGELMFIGASGSRRGQGLWEVSFRFGFQANKTGLSVGAMTAITKDGWDYLWAFYRAVSTADGLAAQPVSAYVARIAERKAFSSLEP